MFILINNRWKINMLKLLLGKSVDIIRLILMLWRF